MNELIQAKPSAEQTQSRATAVIYLRVSSVGQVNKGTDPEGYSIPGQREACKLHAERLGASVVGEYVEPGKSGTSTRRPALQRMLVDLAELKPTYVIVYDLSRVARDDFDALWLLREIEGAGCKLESTLERVDDTPAGKLLYTVMAGVNAFRSRGDAEKVRMGMRSKHLKGETVRAAPIGYLNVRRYDNGREIRTIEVDPERAPFVRTAFDLYATGQHSIAQLTEILDSMGLRTKPTRKRPAHPLGKSVVEKMLHQDYYIGVVTWKGEKVDGTHPPIVDLQLFERVQEVLRAKYLTGTRVVKHEHYLKGSLYCGVCGGRMLYVQAKGNGGTYEYFRCFGRFNAGKDCYAPHTRCIEVETAVADEYLRRQLDVVSKMSGVKEAIEGYATSKAAVAEREVAKAEKRLNDLKLEQQKLIQLSYRDLVSDDVLAAEQTRIRKEQTEIARWKTVAEKDSEEILSALEEALRLLEEAPAAYERATPDVRRLLNVAIWKRLVVLDGEIVVSDLQPWAQAIVAPADEPEATPGTSASGQSTRQKFRTAEGRLRGLCLPNAPEAVLLKDGQYAGIVLWQGSEAATRLLPGPRQWLPPRLGRLQRTAGGGSSACGRFVADDPEVACSGLEPIERSLEVA